MRDVILDENGLAIREGYLGWEWTGRSLRRVVKVAFLGLFTKRVGRIFYLPAEVAKADLTEASWRQRHFFMSDFGPDYLPQEVEVL